VTAFCEAISNNGADAGGSARYKSCAFWMFHHAFLKSNQTAILKLLNTRQLNKLRRASLSANADGSADDEQAAIA
jgi:hypothetical protein